MSQKQGKPQIHSIPLAVSIYCHEMTKSFGEVVTIRMPHNPQATVHVFSQERKIWHVNKHRIITGWVEYYGYGIKALPAMDSKC